MRIEQLLHAIELEKRSYAVQALSSPVRRDAFEYGERSGYLQGLSRVETLIDEILNQEDESGKIRR